MKEEINSKERSLPKMSAEELREKEKRVYREFEKRFDMGSIFDQLTEEDRIKHNKRSLATVYFDEPDRGIKRSTAM